MGKRIMILGTGAQGSATAKYMDDMECVDEIICADTDENAINELVGSLKKGKGQVVDAGNRASIVEAARGVDIIVNGLPLQFGANVLEAALEVGANYQDFAPPTEICDDYLEGMDMLYKDYGRRFREKGRLALTGTGSAPGVMCVAARLAVKPLDTCETIYFIVEEGLRVKRFQPFWWSPVTALLDMEEYCLDYEEGELVRKEPFTEPVYRKYPYMPDTVRFVQHDHEEPVFVAYNAETHFKGCRNSYFRYAGPGVEFAEPLYNAGLLSREKEEIDGVMVSPFDVVVKHLPPAPKYPDEIGEIIDEGIISENGCAVVEAYGTKDGRKKLVEVHVSSPGIEESFRRKQMTSEMYFTGQGGAMFTRLLAEDGLEQTGLISSDMLTYSEIDRYIDYARELDITFEIIEKDSIEEEAFA